ncbi:MAG: SseB family protein, partial [Polyangiales bacterium]
MAAGRLGGVEPDEETAAFRRLLLRALDDDAARSQALAMLAERPVLAATWPGSAEAVRTLTNSDGEQAMPLFTDHDELLAAARRFGWVNPDGSISHRELHAREALHSALEQRVHFVVIDLCADHAIELTHRELATAVAAPTLQAAAGRAPARAASPEPRPSVPSLGEIDEPFAAGPTPQPERSSVPVAVAEIVVSPRGGAARRDPRAEPDLPPPRTALAAVALAPRGAVSKRRATSRDDPKRTTVDFGPATGGVPETAPHAGLPALEPAQPAAAEFTEFPTLVGVGADPSLSASTGFDGGFPLASDGEPEANPAALEAAVLVTQVAKLAKDEATQQAAAEVAEMLKDMARKGGVDDSEPSAQQSAAKTLASMLGAELELAVKPGRGGSRAKLEAAPPAQPADAPAAQDASSARKFHALEKPLADALLSAIADALRKYPEVEWACEVGNGSPLPLIGLRIEPSFLTRAGEIEAAVMAIASAQKTDLQVLLLGDAQ